tara:strand:- start:92 stop:499 length:408 start_codon:yes stop_codon:yes gene_type:complete
MALGGRWSFMRALEKIDSKTADSIKAKLKARGSTFGRLTSMVPDIKPSSKTSSSKANALKIGKTSGPGTIFSTVVEEAKKKKEDPSYKPTVDLLQAVVSRDKKKAESSGKSLVASKTAKKKEKKPVNPGTAAINV